MFRFLYLISKVRGAKVMVRWFPHEVSELEPTLGLLQEQDPQDHKVTIALQTVYEVKSGVHTDLGDTLHPPALALHSGHEPI